MTADNSPLSNTIVVPQVAGPITVRAGLFGPQFFVHNIKVPRKGKTVTFAGANGQSVEGKLRLGWQPNPTLHVNGQDYLTGPQHPTWHLILAYLPAILVLGGLVGAAVGCLGILANYRIMHTQLAAGPKGVALGAATALTVIIGVIVIGTASILLKQ